VGIALLCLWCVVPTTASSYDPSPFGINGIKYEWACRLPDGWANAAKSANIMKQVGVYWDRDPIPWGAVQPEKDKWDWTCPDAVAKFNREQGISSIILLSGCSAWSNNTPPLTDEERAAYAEFVFRMVSRYKDTFKVWEIWNEPNIPFFWPEPNPEHYTLLLKEAYKAAKRADPTCTILAGNTSGPDLTFIRDIHEHGGWDYCDGICIHPYSMAGGPIPQRFDRICRMTKQLVNSTGRPKSVWITEMGWTAAGEREERNQAIYLVQSYVIALANGVEKLCWFDLDDWEEKWGIIKTASPFKPKLAYTACGLLTKALGSPGKCAEFEGWLDTPEGTACYVFRKSGGERVLIIWSDDGRAREVDVRQRSGLGAVDVLGTSVQVSGGRLAVGEVPVIVFGADAKRIGKVSRSANPYLERTGENLVINGDMEIVHGKQPGWWNAGRFDGTAKDGTFATCEEGRGGGKCVSISGSGERAAYDASPIPVYPGRSYRLTAWARTQDATGDNRVGIFWYVGNMWTYISDACSEPLTGTRGWTKLTVTATAPRDALFARVNLISANNTGTVWFDDVSLVEQ
jgi:hypothetical protein